MGIRRAVLALLALGACGRQVIPVVADGVPSSGTSRATTDPTFEVVARIAGARDPMAVGGADVAYADLETALGQAVSRAVPPRHDSILTVELVAGDADFRETRLEVSLVARATLRSRLGNTFVAQKQVICRDGAIVEPARGTRVVWSCMTRLGQDLGGWLAGLAP